MYGNTWNPSGPLRRDSPFALTPWVRRLLIANATVFLLTVTIFAGGDGPGWVLDVFAFAPSGAWERPWTVLTYMFIHGGFLHLAVNSLMLFFFGPPVEEQMGSPRFLRYYLFCGVGGAVLSATLQFIWPMGAIIGASGAIFGIALAFALFWPNAPIMLFPIPVPIKAKWVVIGFATFDLTLQVLGASNGVARLAHLGGFLFGLLYLRGLPYLTEHTNQAADRKREAARVLVHPSAAEAGRPTPDPRPASDKPSRGDAVDRILDKISNSGMESLTPDERRILEERSRQLRRD